MTDIEQAEEEFTEWLGKVSMALGHLDRIILKVNGEEVLITDYSLAGPGIVVVTGETKASGREAIEMAGTYEAKRILDGKGPGKLTKYAEKIIGNFLPTPDSGETKK